MSNVHRHTLPASPAQVSLSVAVPKSQKSTWTSFINSWAPHFSTFFFILIRSAASQTFLMISLCSLSHPSFSLSFRSQSFSVHHNLFVKHISVLFLLYPVVCRIAYLCVHPEPFAKISQEDWAHRVRKWFISTLKGQYTSCDETMGSETNLK